MPMITSFYGIIIYIYFKNKEHNPPHFHAQYGEHEGIFDIRTLELIDGEKSGESCTSPSLWRYGKRRTLKNCRRWNNGRPEWHI